MNFLLIGMFLLVMNICTYAAEYTLENQSCRIIVNNNRITSLFDKIRNVEHGAGILSSKSILKIQLVNGTTLLTENDLNAMTTQVTQAENLLIFNFTHSMVTGTASLALSDQPGEIIFTVKAKPANPLHAIAHIDFPSFETQNKYNGKEKYCLTPYREGRLTPISVVLSAGNEYNSYFTYPKFLFSQFIACLGDQGGFLFWTDDTKGYTKEFGRDYMKDVSHFTIKHFMQYEYGYEQSLSYNSRITFTGPKWYDVADIYRKWSENQPWSSVKLKDRPDIPDILLKRTPLIISGQIDKDNLTTLPSKLKSWVDLCDAPVIYRPLGWEKNGNWNGIDYFPTSTGDEIFKDMAKRLKDNGIITSGFISGYSWKTSSPAMKLYFDEHNGAGLCETDRQDKLKNPLRVCRGSEFGKSFLQNTASSMFDLAMSVIHNDVDYGTYQFVSEGCFNKYHGHPIPCGLWEVDFTRKSFQEIKKEAQNRGVNDFFLSKEYFTEQFIQDIHSSQARFFKTLEEPFQVPLAQYLFHDFIFTSFGLCTANGAINLTSMMLIAGQVPSFAFWNKGVDPASGGNVAQNILLTDYFSAMKSHGKQFLSFGKMRRELIEDVPYKTRSITKATVMKPGGGSEEITLPVPYTELVPIVVQSAWEDDMGNVGVFAINTRATALAVNVTVPEGGYWQVATYLGSTKQSTRVAYSGQKIPLTLAYGRVASVVFNKVPVGTPLPQIEIGFELYPNPVKDKLIVNAKLPEAIQSIQVYSTQGNCVRSLNGINFTSEIGVEDLQSGVYLIEVQYKNLTVVRRKFIKL